MLGLNLYRRLTPLRWRLLAVPFVRRVQGFSPVRRLIVERHPGKNIMYIGSATALFARWLLEQIFCSDAAAGLPQSKSHPARFNLGPLRIALVLS